MSEFFHHLFPPDLPWLFSQYGNAIYVVLFLIIFIETGLVIWPFLPGDSLLFLAGLFAKGGLLNMGFLVLLLFTAAVLGDNTNYWIGRLIGTRVLRWKFRGKNLVKQEYIDKTHSFFEKYGVKTIIMARFVPIVRTFSPFVAGTAEMKYSKFLPFDILGGAIWILGLTFAGYFLGDFEFFREHIEMVAVGIVLVSLLPIVFGVIRAKRKKA